MEGCTEKCKTARRLRKGEMSSIVIVLFSYYRFVVLLVTSDTLGPALTKLQAGGLLHIPTCLVPYVGLV